MTGDVGVREETPELIYQPECGHRLQLTGQLVEPEADRLAPAIGAVRHRSPAGDSHQQCVQKILLHRERDWHRDASHADAVVAPDLHPRYESFSRFWRLGHRTCWDRA